MQSHLAWLATCLHMVIKSASVMFFLARFTTRVTYWMLSGSYPLVLSILSKLGWVLDLAPPGVKGTPLNAHRQFWSLIIFQACSLVIFQFQPPLPASNFCLVNILDHDECRGFLLSYCGSSLALASIRSARNMKYLFKANYCMLSVHQHWDPLKLCVVGRGHDANELDFIKDSKTRSILETIAVETEEDFQKLITLLQQLNVAVLRPNYVSNGSKPPVAPRDHIAMLGNSLYIDDDHGFYSGIIQHARSQGNDIRIGKGINSASIIRLGKDLLLGELDVRGVLANDLILKGMQHQPAAAKNKMIDMLSRAKGDAMRRNYRSLLQEEFGCYNLHMIPDAGHIDGSVCPIRPGLVLAADFMADYAKDFFKGWEIVVIKRYDNMSPDWLKFAKTMGSQQWWIPGQQPDHGFIDYVHTYLEHWVGNITETFFQVNTLIIDQENVICINFPDQLLRLYESMGIAAHAMDFRHRFFWDSGIHCITADLDREGQQRDDCLISSTCLQALRKP